MSLKRKQTRGGVKNRTAGIMDNADNMGDWQMLRARRKLVVRRRDEEGKRQREDDKRKKSTIEWDLQREREREREGERESRTDMGHGDIRQMAQSAQLCLHYSHWSSKNSHETKAKPAARWAFCRWMPPVSLHACSHDFHVWMCVFPAHVSILSAEIHSTCVSLSMRLSSQAQTNCLLFSRGQGLVGLQSTQ